MNIFDYKRLRYYFITINLINHNDIKRIKNNEIIFIENY